MSEPPPSKDMEKVDDTTTRIEYSERSNYIEDQNEVEEQDKVKILDEFDYLSEKWSKMLIKS